MRTQRDPPPPRVFLISGGLDSCRSLCQPEDVGSILDISGLPLVCLRPLCSPASHFHVPIALLSFCFRGDVLVRLCAKCGFPLHPGQIGGADNVAKVAVFSISPIILPFLPLLVPQNQLDDWFQAPESSQLGPFYKMEAQLSIGTSGPSA